MKQHVVQDHDLLPVGVLPTLGFGMAGNDRGLQLIRAGPPKPGGAGQYARRPGDCFPVPQGPVLMRQQNEVIVDVEPGRRAGTVQPDERQQARYLGLGRHQRVKQRRQPLGVVDEVAGLHLFGCAQVTLIEQQVDDRKDFGQPGTQVVIRRDPVRNPASVILRFARVILCAIVVSGTRNARAI